MVDQRPRDDIYHLSTSRQAPLAKGFAYDVIVAMMCAIAVPVALAPSSVGLSPATSACAELHVDRNSAADFCALEPA
jgi:hypothetical protein